MLAFALFMLSVGIVGLYVSYKKRNNAFQEQRKLDQYHTNRIRKAEEDLTIAEQNLREKIEKNFGSRAFENVSNKIIWQNMPDYLLKLSIEEPSHKKETFYKGNRAEAWYYYPYINRLGNTKYKLEVTTENGFVVGWKDLN